MTKTDLHFFLLNANQAAVIIGLFETLSITWLYFTVGAFFTALVEDVRFVVFGNDFQEILEIIEIDDQYFYAGTGKLLLGFLIPMFFPLLLMIGAVKGIRCMMLPWIIVGWLRAVVGTFLFITVFAFPMGSCAQVFIFASHSIYFAMTVHSLHVVSCSYKHLGLIEP